MKKISKIIKEEIGDFWDRELGDSFRKEMDNKFNKELGYIPSHPLPYGSDADKMYYDEVNKKRNQEISRIVMSNRAKWERMQRDDLKNIPNAIEKGWTLEFEYNDRNSILSDKIPADAVGFKKDNKIARKRYHKADPDWEKNEKFSKFWETWMLLVNGNLAKEYETIEELLDKES